MGAKAWELSYSPPTPWYCIILLCIDVRLWPRTTRMIMPGINLMQQYHLGAIRVPLPTMTTYGKVLISQASWYRQSHQSNRTITFEAYFLLHSNYQCKLSPFEQTVLPRPRLLSCLQAPPRCKSARVPKQTSFSF